MVTLTIDNRTVTVPEGTTILEAARSVRLDIPTLCYLKDINEIGACRICMVEVEGEQRLVAACDTQVAEGIVVHTNSPRVREARRVNLRLLLAQHDIRCPKCTRSGNCKLQQLTNDYNLLGNHYIKDLRPIEPDFSTPVVRFENRCIRCMRCIQVCDKIQVCTSGPDGHRYPHYHRCVRGQDVGRLRLHLLRPVHDPLSRGRFAGARRHRQGLRRAGQSQEDHRRADGARRARGVG